MSGNPSRCIGCSRSRLLLVSMSGAGWAFLAAIVGCSNTPRSDGQPPARVVGVQAFSSDSPTPAATQSTTTSPASTAIADSPATSASTVSSAAVNQPPDDANARSVEIDTARPMAPGQEAVIESLIGQVSGRPIFVDAFLEPIDDQLRREGERLPPAEFLPRAQEIIGRRLSEVVLNELFLAEAEASLTQPQKMGLLAYLKNLQEKNIAEAGGTLFGAQTKVASEQEMSLSEYEAAQKDQALIGNLLYQRVAPRVIVSWRDVEREYELRKAEFNPPASVTLLRLLLDDATQKELIEQVKARFAANETFTQIIAAMNLSEYVTIVGGGPLTMKDGQLGGVEVAEELKPYLAKLKPEAGATTEAIARPNSRTAWFSVEKIEQLPARTIYHVQEELIATLRARRENEERQKYINTLLQKGIYDELDEMNKRVLAVVLLRYGQ